MLSEEIKKVVIDDEKLKIIRKFIIEAERDNLKTKESSNSEMVVKLKEIIEKIVLK